jgi:hypothetical protein
MGQNPFSTGMAVLVLLAPGSPSPMVSLIPIPIKDLFFFASK